jgi:hypothetical protein
LRCGVLDTGCNNTCLYPVRAESRFLHTDIDRGVQSSLETFRRSFTCS